MQLTTRGVGLVSASFPFPNHNFLMRHCVSRHLVGFPRGVQEVEQRLPAFTASISGFQSTWRRQPIQQQTDGRTAIAASYMDTAAGKTKVPGRRPTVVQQSRMKPKAKQNALKQKKVVFLSSLEKREIL